MLTEEALSIIAAAEAIGDEAAALSNLRQLSIDEFGEFLLDPSAYPFLASFLPRMPEDDIQMRWTGAVGMELLQQTLPFVRFLEESYAAARRKPLRDAVILDYGCGWGRMTRLLIRYTDPKKIWGLDPLDVSLGFCRDHGVKGNFVKIDPLPTKLPVTQAVDLSFAYSIFTHTSEKTTRTCLQALQAATAKDGVAVFTIRPVEFWARKKNPEMAVIHRRDGYAFQGDGRMTFDGEDTYGHASMSRARITQILHETGWRLVQFDHALVDEFQTRVVAQKA